MALFKMVEIGDKVKNNKNEIWTVIKTNNSVAHIIRGDINSLEKDSFIASFSLGGKTVFNKNMTLVNKNDNAI